MRRHILRLLVGLMAGTALAVASPRGQSVPATPGSGPPSAAALPKDVDAAMRTISRGRIVAHLRFLADDLLEGRGTGQRGGDLAALYIATQFQLTGLYPGGAGGSYMQRVPLVGVETQPETSLTFTPGAGPSLPPIKYKDDYVLWTETQQPSVDSEGDMIFVGHGVVAPEFKWDDYKGANVAGKVLVMLVDDPPSDDPNFFGGKARTIYGRWTWKYEIAAKKGAIGALLIHTDASAGYGWQVVRGSWGRERAFNELDPNAPAPLKQAGWVTEATGRALLKAAGQDLDALIASAAKPDFAPIPLGMKSKAHVVSRIRRMDTANVIGYIPGTEEPLKDQAVIVTAHYDHLGLGDPDATGDRIYNGAYDNASGVATMLEMARAFNLATVKPRRTVVFIGAAAEEMGLLGSEYYAAHPTFPPGRIAANFNLDGVTVLGSTKDMSFLGGERSTLWNYLQDAAAVFGFTISPDAHPEQGSFFRSDHYNFAKIGVPAVSIEHGQNFEGHDPAWGETQWMEYNQQHYHQPSDQYQQTWDLSGAQKEAMITFYLTYRVATADAMPSWKPGDEFAAARQAATKTPGPGSK